MDSWPVIFEPGVAQYIIVTVTLCGKGSYSPQNGQKAKKKRGKGQGANIPFKGMSPVISNFL
jgi:hypothetical protein